MLRCNDCRPLIPDLLYGLLDAPEAAAVAAHLDTCPGCAAARDEAARVQGLIAAAARGTFPAVRFEPPVARPRTPTPAPTVRRPAVVPFPPPDSRAATPAARPAPRGDSATSRAARWLPWAVAAAVLVAVPGTAVPVLDLIRKAEAARGEADRSVAAAAAAVDALKAAEEEAERPRTVARANLAAAQQAHDALLARWVADEKAVARAAEARKPAWDVRKPAAVQPGAPNEFLLSVRDPGTGPAGRLVAEVRDQTDAVIHSQPINIEQSPDHTVRLPASVWEKLTPLSELFLTVTRVDEKTGAKTDLPDRVRLLGPVYATVLTTDKAAYRPGETVYFRSLTLDRVSLTPPAREQVLRYELRGPGGPVRGAPPVEGSTDLVRVAGGGVGPVAGPDGKPVRGVGCGAFPLPPDASDGDYTLVLRELPAGGPPAVPFEVTRTVKVRAGAAEAYRKRAGFSAESYAPGDTVEAWVELRRGGEPVAGVGVTAVALADGTALRVEPVGAPVTGENGRAVFRFALPRDLDRADVRLKATFDVGKDKGPAEEVADRVPVVGRRVTVEFFPEGGNLVAGVPCRVYARATTPAGHPVAVSGVVTDGRQVLARVQTPNDPAEPGANRGIAVFEFTPRLGTPAWLRLDAPAAHAPLLIPEGGVPTLPAAAAGASAVAGARTGFVLPEAKRDGVVMTVPDPVTAPGQPVRVHLRSVGGERNLVVGAYTRGRLSDTRRVTVAPGRVAEARLMAGTDPRGGVVRVTVFEEPAGDPDGPKGDLVPVAERLVFRKPGEALNLNFTANAARAGAAGFAPGSAVELAVTAADEKGNPAAAVLFATAVDAAAAPGPTDRLLTTHFLLAGEVNGPDALEHADFLLTDRPGAAEALDRVLATQGWRRFAEQTPEGFARRPAVASAEHRGLLECNGQYLTADPARERDHQRVRDEYRPRYEAAVKALAAAKGELDAARATGPGDAPARREAAAQLRAEAVAAGDRADEAAAPVARFRASGWYAVGGFGLLAALLAGAALARPVGRLPFGAGSLGAVGLAAFLVAALGMADRIQAASRPPGEPDRLAAPEPVAVAPAPRPARERKFVLAAPGIDAMAEAALGTAAPGVKGSVPPPVVPLKDPGGRWGGAGMAKIQRPTLPSYGGVPTALPAAPSPGDVVAGKTGPKSEPDRRGWQVISDDLLERSKKPAGLSEREALSALIDATTKAAVHRREAEQARAYADAKAGAVRAQLEKSLARTPGLVPEAPAAAPVGGVVVGRVTQRSADAEAVYRVWASVPEVTPLVVREYAAPRPGSADPPAAGDTVLWQPVIVLPADGKAKLNFHLGHAPGGYQVVVAGHTPDGRVGAVRGVIPVAPPAPPAR